MRLVLTCSVIGIGVVWAAVFVCMLIDKMRGYRGPVFLDRCCKVPDTSRSQLPTTIHSLGLSQYLLLLIFLPFLLAISIILLPIMIFKVLQDLVVWLRGHKQHPRRGTENR
jgi:hypothetical protein